MMVKSMSPSKILHMIQIIIILIQMNNSVITMVLTTIKSTASRQRDAGDRIPPRCLGLRA